MLRQVGAFALATDSRSAIWNGARRVSVLDAVIDHVADGRAIPKWVHKADPDDQSNHCLLELWRLAEKAIRAAYKPEASEAAA